MIEHRILLISRFCERLVRTGLVALLVLAAPPLATAKDGQVVALKSEIAVEATFITLGDLFLDAGAAADVVVSEAPAPGHRLVLTPRSVALFAAKHGLVWRNAARVKRVVIYREGKTIAPHVVIEALTRALEQNTGGGSLDVEISGRPPKPTIPVYAEDSVEVLDLTYDRSTGTFKATLKAGGTDPEAQTVRVSGRAYAALSVPTLSRYMQAGDVIEESDIEWRRLRMSRIARATITDQRDLVGMALKRQMPPYQPLRASDVTRPVVISKGSLITLIYRSANMVLTAEGRALTDGGEGETIRVLNTQSKRTVEAFVLSPHEATVSNAAIRLSAYR